MTVRALFAAALLAAAVDAAQAQSLAQRVAAVRDGEVRFRYATRSGVCGDGEKVIVYGDRVFFGTSRSFGWSTGNVIMDRPCRTGMAEARLTVRAGAVTSLRTRVPAPADGEGRDLGAVATADVKTYLLDLIRRDPDVPDQHVYLALTLADSVTVWEDLVRLGSDASRGDRARGQAYQWAVLEGDPAAIPPLAAVLRDRGAPVKVREGAAAGLSHIDDPAAVDILTQYVRTGDLPKLRVTIVHIVGMETPGARADFRAIARDVSAPDDVRGAVFLEMGDSDDPADAELLRSLLPTIKSRKLQQRLLHAVSEADDAESGRWLLSIATDRKYEVEVRKQALFWAGESEGTPIGELVAIYDRLDERRLREHAIFVLHEREEDAALDKLMAIARGDPDPEMRKKAIFWIAERDDEKSAAFIRSILR